MNEPEHHRKYREAWEEHKDCQDEKRRKELEDIMDRVQCNFEFNEFWEFWETLQLPEPDITI